MPSRASSLANTVDERPALGRDALVEVAGLPETLLDLLAPTAAPGPRACAPTQRGVEQLVVGHDAVDEPELVGLVGRRSRRP